MEVQIRYKTVWVISPAGITIPTQVPYEYCIFHTKLVNRGLEVVIREELDNDKWKRYEIFQDTLGGRPYLLSLIHICIISGNTRVNDIGLSMLQSTMMQMDVGLSLIHI